MRLPIVQQHDASDCGPAALAMVAAYYGKRVSLAKLRELSGTDRHGTNLTGLLRAAERVGFQGRGVRASRDALSQVPLPAVAHWRENDRNHFVVIYRVSQKRIVIGDPASGLRKLSP